MSTQSSMSIKYTGSWSQPFAQCIEKKLGRRPRYMVGHWQSYFTNSRCPILKSPTIYFTVQWQSDLSPFDQDIDMKHLRSKPGTVMNCGELFMLNNWWTMLGWVLGTPGDRYMTLDKTFMKKRYALIVYDNRKNWKKNSPYFQVNMHMIEHYIVKKLYIKVMQ